MDRGYSLIELALVVAIVGMMVASAVPATTGLRDRVRVVAAREAVAAALAETRVAAIEEGGAWLTVSPGPGTVQVHTERWSSAPVDLGASFRSSVSSPPGGAAFEIAFDALGLGRVASRTVVLTSGGATAELVVSSYGRIRRR